MLRIGIEGVFLKRCAVPDKPAVSNIFLFIVALFVMQLGAASVASAAKLTLTWVDTSNAESGFRIERRIGTSGSYQPHAQVGANVVTYTDPH